MTKQEAKNQTELGLYNFGLDMLEVAEKESNEDLAKWANSHEGGIAAFIAKSKEEMDQAIHKARFLIAKDKKNGETQDLSEISIDDANKIIAANPEGLPIAARNSDDISNDASRIAVAKIIKQRKDRSSN